MRDVAIPFLVRKESTYLGFVRRAGVTADRAWLHEPSGFEEAKPECIISMAMRQASAYVLMSVDVVYESNSASSQGTIPLSSRYHLTRAWPVLFLQSTRVSSSAHFSEAHVDRRLLLGW